MLAKEHNVQHATFTYMPSPVALHENIPDLERPPPYRPSQSNVSSRSPSQISSIERFTPIPTEQYPYSSFQGTSPIGPSFDTDLKSKRNYTEHIDRVRFPSTPSVQTNDTSGSVEVGELIFLFFTDSISSNILSVKL